MVESSLKRRCVFIEKPCNIEADEIPIEVCYLCIEAWRLSSIQARSKELYHDKHKPKDLKPSRFYLLALSHDGVELLYPESCKLLKNIESISKCLYELCKILGSDLRILTSTFSLECIGYKDAKFILLLTDSPEGLEGLMDLSNSIRSELDRSSSMSEALQKIYSILISRYQSSEG